MSHAFQYVTSAAEFAARCHADQRLKGERQRPCINHLTEVACLVAAAQAGSDAELVAAAYLHDAVEDGHATSGDIATRFGERVCRLVEELTDDKSLPEDERRRRQVQEVPTKSPAARIVKLADKVSKVREMGDDPPAEWTEQHRRAYVEWCVAVVDAGCRGLDAPLEAAFDEAVSRVSARWLFTGSGRSG